MSNNNNTSTVVLFKGDHSCLFGIGSVGIDNMAGG